MINEEQFMDQGPAPAGLTYAEIGRLVGRDWRPVKRYLSRAPSRFTGASAPSLLDPFKPSVDQWLAREPRLLVTRIHQDLVGDSGFEGSYQTVRRYVERSRPRPHPELERRFETAPGHQAQVDWSYEQPLTTDSGLELPLYCFAWCWATRATRSAGWWARWTW